MSLRIGIRREDRSRWERRAPLTPEHVRRLVAAGHEIVVQPSPIRVFPDSAYADAGALLEERLEDCPLLLAVKEIPAALYRPDHIYACFSHTIKGQPHSMPALGRLLEVGASLLDYERITDEHGQRLVAFGRHAGLAGALDSLWLLGQRLVAEGHETAFAALEPAHRYASLDAAREALGGVAEWIRDHGLPEALSPLVIGVSGYGRVSQGAQEIIDLLPNEAIQPHQLPGLPPEPRRIYKVVFEERHTVEPLDAGTKFDLAHYLEHPELYRGCFERHLPWLTLLVNAVYWEPRQPRLITRDQVRHAWAAGAPRLRVIGDLSCDIEGSIEITVEATTPDSPAYVYEPDSQQIHPGVEGPGPVVLAVDNLPAELPAESSLAFGEALEPLLPALAAVDPRAPWADCGLPGPLERATIAWRGQLTPSFAYLAEHLEAQP